jgi:hypothetical protein
MTTTFLIPSYFFSLYLLLLFLLFSFIFLVSAACSSHAWCLVLFIPLSVYTSCFSLSWTFTFLHSLCPCPSFHSSSFFCYCFLRFFNPLYPLTTEYIFYCKRAILFLSSSKILTPHPPLRPASVYPLPLLRGEDRLAGRRGGWGSIFWKTREIGLPSYCKICTLCL